jgi:Tfp pilus assembly PilM family ATPase
MKQYMKKIKAVQKGFGAIELDAKSVKVALTQIVLGRQKLIRLLSAEIGDISKAETRDSLKRVLAQHNIELDSCLLSLSRHSVTTRYLRLPTAVAGEIEKMLELQIPKLLPYAAGEIISSYKVIQVDSQGYSCCMIVLAQQSLVRSYYAFLEKLDIKPSGIVLSSEGICHWLALVKKGSFAEGTLMVVDVDTADADIVISRQGELIFSRTISRQAQEQATDPSWQSKLQDEINRSLQTANKEIGLIKIDRLIFTGSLRGIKDLDKALVSAFNFPIEIIATITPEFINPGSSVERTIANQDVSFVSVAAAALVKQRFVLDFLPADIKKVMGEQKVRRQQRRLLKTVVIVLLLLFALFLKNIYDKKLLLAAIEKRTRALLPQVSSNEQAGAHLEAIRQQLESPVFISELVKVVYEVTPDDITVSNLSIQRPDSLILKGEASSLSSVFNFSARLEKNNYFNKVRVRYALKRRIKGVEFVDFQIDCTLKAVH